MLQKLFPYRFEIFFFSQIASLFGALIVPPILYEALISPLLLIVNLLAGILLVSRKRKLMWFLLTLLILAIGVLIIRSVSTDILNLLNLIQMGTFFAFYVVVTIAIIMQVWGSKYVGKNVILGLISGYISLGLIGFFIFLGIEMVFPGSFSGLELLADNPVSQSENLLYYSYITLLTIGYGDITPVTLLAKKAAVLIGLMGQIYLVVITAVIVGKYTYQRNDKNSSTD